MKTKKVFACMCMLVCSVLIISKVQAQQSEQAVNPALQQLQNSPGAKIYTYKVFRAPSKMYGYDILLNGKTVFHQFASTEKPGSNNAVMAKKEHAEKAAALSIEKMQSGQTPSLTLQEIKRIVNNHS